MIFTYAEFDVGDCFAKYPFASEPIIIHNLRGELNLKNMNFFDGLNGNGKEIGNDLYITKLLFRIESSMPFRQFINFEFFLCIHFGMK